VTLFISTHERSHQLLELVYPIMHIVGRLGFMGGRRDVSRVVTLERQTSIHTRLARLLSVTFQPFDMVSDS
jgi:hypothetical protein